MQISWSSQTFAHLFLPRSHGSCLYQLLLWCSNSDFLLPSAWLHEKQRNPSLFLLQFLYTSLWGMINQKYLRLCWQLTPFFVIVKILMPLCYQGVFFPGGQKKKSRTLLNTDYFLVNYVMLHRSDQPEWSYWEKYVCCFLSVASDLTQMTPSVLASHRRDGMQKISWQMFLVSLRVHGTSYCITGNLSRHIFYFLVAQNLICKIAKTDT